MTRGGEGPSAAEVATSFPARLLGAIEELRKFLNSWMKRKKKKSQVLWKIKREVIRPLYSPIGLLSANERLKRCLEKGTDRRFELIWNSA